MPEIVKNWQARHIIVKYRLHYLPCGWPDILTQRVKIAFIEIVCGDVDWMTLAESDIKLLQLSVNVVLKTALFCDVTL
jgi:hypothetical protein